LACVALRDRDTNYSTIVNSSALGTSIGEQTLADWAYFGTAAVQ
jgi:hypothetical protein